MSISSASLTELVQAAGVRFDGNRLVVRLSDGREVSVPMGQVEWLKWLFQATPQQREKWSIEPGGFAVYWEDLDDGFEIGHLLALHPLS